jgi:hypothetical protein
MQHYWEHFAFGRDRQYLRSRAYPLMNEIVEMWRQTLKELPQGVLVVPQTQSPEVGPCEDGVSFSQHVIWDLFDNVERAVRVLEEDKVYAPWALLDPNGRYWFWDHIFAGVRKNYLLEEYHRSLNGELRQDCREQCFSCGILPTFSSLRRQTPGEEWKCPEVPARTVKEVVTA